MERQTLDQAALDTVTTKRAEHLAAAANGEDDYLDAQHRRNREHVLGPLCRVKVDDDVQIGTETIRVIGAARDESWFMGLLVSPWGNLDVPYNGSYITDRAPADPEEEALPIFLEGYAARKSAPDPEESGSGSGSELG